MTKDENDQKNERFINSNLGNVINFTPHLKATGTYNTPQWQLGVTGYDSAMTTREYTTRPELDAELRSMRSDIKASQAELRADIANMQTSIVDRLSAVATSINEQKIGMATLQGEVSSVKSALSTTRWVVGTVIAAAAMLISAVQFYLATVTSPATSKEVIYMQAPADLPAAAAPPQQNIAQPD